MVHLIVISLVFTMLTCACHTDKPSPPRNFRVTEVFKDFVVVAWDTPESDGGSPITEYLVEKRDAKRETYTKVAAVDATTFNAKATKLIEGNQYYFRVFAENEVGMSDPAQLDDPVTAKLPFGRIQQYFLNL